MASNDQQRQWAIEGFLGRFDELERVLGPDVKPVLERVRAELITALAERDRGENDAAILRVSRAMTELAALGDRLGPEEGAMMRALAARFTEGMQRGDRAEAEMQLDRIQAQTGTPKERR